MEKPVQVVIKTDTFMYMESVWEKTLELVEKAKEINPNVDLAIEVDLRD